MTDAQNSPTAISIFLKQPPKLPPEGDNITLTHALTWLAFRVSVCAEDLIADLTRADPAQEEIARRELIRATNRLTAAGSDGRIKATGCFARLYQDARETPARMAIPAEALLEFRRFDVFVNGLQRGEGLGFLPLSQLLDTAAMPRVGDEYHKIQVSRAGFVRRLRPNETWLNRATTARSTNEVPPNLEDIRSKAAEMRERGLMRDEIASQMRYEPGFKDVKVEDVRVAIKGEARRGPRKR